MGCSWPDLSFRPNCLIVWWACTQQEEIVIIMHPCPTAAHSHFDPQVSALTLLAIVFFFSTHTKLTGVVCSLQPNNTYSIQCPLHLEWSGHSQVWEHWWCSTLLPLRAMPSRWSPFPGSIRGRERSTTGESPCSVGWAIWVGYRKRKSVALLLFFRLHLS